MEKIYEIKRIFPGFPSISVYPNRVVFTSGLAYMRSENVIFVNTISSVDTKGTSTKVFVRTNDGKVHDLLTMGFKKRDALKEAILSTMK